MGIYAVIRIKSINSMKATTSGGKLQVGGRKFWTNCRAGVGGTFIWGEAVHCDYDLSHLVVLM